jgi:hypothetical protein
MSVATVVGMVVSIPGKHETYDDQNLEKTFLVFPEEKETDGCLPVKMLMLDGYGFISSLCLHNFICFCFRRTWQDRRVLWTKTLVGIAKVSRLLFHQS